MRLACIRSVGAGPIGAPLDRRGRLFTGLGILEEGLGDVIAEALNPEYEEHIRSHRLLNASAFTGGIALEVVYRQPEAGSWRRRCSCC